VEWTFVVRNTGNVPLFGVTIVDDPADDGDPPVVVDCTPLSNTGFPLRDNYRKICSFINCYVTIDIRSYFRSAYMHIRRNDKLSVINFVIFFCSIKNLEVAGINIEIEIVTGEVGSLHSSI
jgi:hypothetical protein